MPPRAPGPLVLEIARIGLEVHTTDPELLVVPEPAHLPFLTEDPGEDCARVVLGPSSGRVVSRSRGRMIFDTGSVWRLEESGDSRLLTFRSPLFGTEPYLAVEFDTDYTIGRGETLVGGPHLGQGELHPFVYPFDEVVFLARLARGRGVLVHGCGLIHEEQGILFLGTSGAGKTTTAKLWRQHARATILSDDRIVIRAEKSGFRIYGTPWHGEGGFETPGSAPLRAVFLLEQSPRNRLEDLTPSTAVAQMMVRSFPAMWDQEGVDYAVRLLADLAGQIPVRRLHFQPEQSAIEAVLAAVGLECPSITPDEIEQPPTGTDGRGGAR